MSWFGPQGYQILENISAGYMPEKKIALSHHVILLSKSTSCAYAMNQRNV